MVEPNHKLKNICLKLIEEELGCQPGKNITDLNEKVKLKVLCLPVSENLVKWQSGLTVCGTSVYEEGGNCNDQLNIATKIDT